jgi:hypothetical protein
MQILSGEMLQNHHNKAWHHGVPKFTVIDMGASLAIGQFA